MNRYEENLIRRIDHLLAVAISGSTPSAIGELMTSAINLMSSLYGPQSAQVGQLRESISTYQKQGAAYNFTIVNLLHGALLALKEDIESGLVKNLQRAMSGEVYGDMLILAKEVFRETEEGPKNIAAVLVAALYEDTIRRLGKVYAGIESREKLDVILQTLKKKEIMQASQFGVAQSYLQFRNDALHADWEKIDRATVAGLLSFVEELLAKHFR